MTIDLAGDALRDQPYTPFTCQVASLEEAEVHITSLTNRVDMLEKRMRYLEDLFDSWFDSPLWKRLVFIVDGWPMDRISNRPRPGRPWRRWWTS